MHVTSMDIAQLAARIEQVPLNQSRRIIAIVGAPASGKSTLAEKLVKMIPNACIVPMDGFHRDNADLERDGLLARKGAPQTFHAQAFVDFIRSCRTASDLAYPTFDRSLDRSIENGGTLRPQDQTILVEGNYLLLNQPPWNALLHEWDFSVHLDVPLATLRDRLINRWLENGYDRIGATARAQGNDIPNAQLVQQDSLQADVTLQSN